MFVEASSCKTRFQCPVSEKNAKMEGIMDIVGDSLTEPEWLETQVPSAGDFRIWHLIFFGLSGVLSISESACPRAKFPRRL